MADSEAIKVIRELSDYAATVVAPGFADVGKGIGAIMLLVVVIYYITSILDGGKFQIKMLLPLLIFLFVCNFSWIATPVTAFTTIITESLVEACDNTKNAIKEKNNCSETANINDINNQKMAEESPNADLLMERTGLSEQQTEPDADISDDSDSNMKPTAGKTRGLSGVIKRGIDNELNDLSLRTQAELSGEKYAAVGDYDPSKKHFTNSNTLIQSIISSIISWICDVMSYVVRAFGGIMTGVIVAFGPITFAFAIFPGQGGTIKSWFIRLCQFSLWAPLCALVDCFSYKILDMCFEASSCSSFFTAIFVALLNLVTLTSVPTIASMIIEGAQGAVSLSQGLQTMAGAATTAGGIGAVLVGQNRVTAARDTLGGMQNLGLAGIGKDIRENGFKGFGKRMQASGMRSRIGKK